MKKKIKVLSSVKLNLKDKELKKLKEKVNLQFSINSKKETLKKIKESDVYIASAAVNLDKNDIGNAKNLKIIFSPSTGTDHIDIEELKKKKN